MANGKPAEEHVTFDVKSKVVKPVENVKKYKLCFGKRFVTPDPLQTFPFGYWGASGIDGSICRIRSSLNVESEFVNVSRQWKENLVGHRQYKSKASER